MMMKFGRIVDLEALQTLSVNTNLEELKMRIMEREQLYALELKNWDVRLDIKSYCGIPCWLSLAMTMDRAVYIWGISSVKTVLNQRRVRTLLRREIL